MTPSFDDVARLRDLFVAGATPSRLIDFIAERHASDANWTRHVQPYFSAAFSVIVLNWENRSPDFSIGERLAHYLNTAVLHEIVGRAHLWRDTVTTLAPGEKAWFDGHDISPSELHLIDSIHPKSHPALSESWPVMSSKSRFFVRQAMVNSQSYYETTQILARLVQKLQEQLANLESQIPVAAATFD